MFSTVYQLSLKNANFEGKNNAYLLSGSEVVLIDTGIATDETRKQLRAGLDRYGFSFEDIDDIFLTHYHADHAGLAGEIQEASGATVFAHPTDAELLEGETDAWNGLKELYLSLFEEWGIPREKREEVIVYKEGRPRRYSGDLLVEPIRDGDRFDIGGVKLEVLHTPGHTQGLSSFVMTESNEIFTGDVLLPVYTPNVGGADVRVENPLALYLDSLCRIIDQNFERAWPGHRHAIEDPTDRATFIIEHHAERAWKVVRILSELSEADAWTVSHHLFGELERNHILHGPGEAYAHLDHLTRLGDVERVKNRYRLLDEARARFEDRNSKTWPLQERSNHPAPRETGKR